MYNQNLESDGFLCFHKTAVFRVVYHRCKTGETNIKYGILTLQQ